MRRMHTCAFDANRLNDHDRARSVFAAWLTFLVSDLNNVSMCECKRHVFANTVFKWYCSFQTGIDNATGDGSSNLDKVQVNDDLAGIPTVANAQMSSASSCARRSR